MNTKLTLTLEKEVIQEAKAYAKITAKVCQKWWRIILRILQKRKKTTLTKN